jgi:threonine synthase
VKYVSTRGTAPVLEFGDVLLAGLARDGGLYVPESWPVLAPGDLVRFADLPYAEIATEVMWPFVEGTLERDTFAALVADTYATFDHPDVVPLRALTTLPGGEPMGGGVWLMELFHGPTLAFKDVALQLVGRLFDHELRRRGDRVTIVGATSGDTGSAAIEACRDRDAIDVFIMHPAGRVSEVQRRQMTTVPAANIHNIAVEGTFDDCQDLVKALFADTELRDRRHLSAVNSINWARVLAQVVYYVLGSARLTAGHGPVAYTVPTGNFGNVFAGYGAQRMGTPISQLSIGSNVNDILTRFLATGTMEMTGVEHTLSPSMDIQISSNFERLLFELYGRDGTQVVEAMARFRAEGHFTVDADRMGLLREHWSGARVDDEGTKAIIAEMYERTGVIVDPHTAVGLGAAAATRRDPAVPMITLATAHPAKFPDAVEAAIGIRPELPPHLADLFEREERFVTLPNDLDAVRGHIESTLGPP